MDFIGNQISVKRSENELSIVILSAKEKTKNIMLLVWLFLWTASGFIMLFEYFATIEPDVKTVLIVWGGFWIYFEYKIIKAFRWRKYGKEIIKIKDGNFSYKLDVSNRGKIKVYAIESMKNLRLVEQKENSFFENLNNSYWVIAQEKIVFDYFGAEIKFGFQLIDADAKALLKLLKNNLTK